MWFLLSSSFALPDVEEVIVEQDPRPWTEAERGDRTADPSTLTGVYHLTRRDIDATPGALEDITRATHALPGVVSDGDIFAGFHVRGGEQSNVVFVLDRVPLENPFHLAGFNSLFNPDLIKEVRFYAGAAPADVPSGTSAVVDVASWDGRQASHGGIDGSVDLSLTSARAFLNAPIDRKRRWSLALAARRTYLEGYLAVLEALNIVDSAFIAPEFSELSARLRYQPHTRHRFLLSVLRAGDSLRLANSGETSATSFDGSLDLNTSLLLGSLDHRYQSNRLSVQTAAVTRDRSFSNRELERDTLRQDLVQRRAFLRSDLSWSLSPNATLKLGLDGSRFDLRSEGLLQDRRAFPTWAQGGMGAYGFQVAEVQPPDRSWSEANGYVQTELLAPFGGPSPGGGIVPGLKLRTGLRVGWSALQQAVLPSPRFGLSLPLRTGTIPKISGGLYRRAIRDPFVLATDFGNPLLQAEQARHLVLGVDQGLPLPQAGHLLLRVEAYCYSAAGAGAASSSNLATTSSVPAVDLYVSDPGNPTTIGHRRWILGSWNSGIGVGSAANYSCMVVGGSFGGAGPEWVAWPPPGIVPIQAMTASWQSVDSTGWTVQSDSISFANATIEVTQGGIALAVDPGVLLPNSVASTRYVSRRRVGTAPRARPTMSRSPERARRSATT